jgi:hypothetical protein
MARGEELGVGDFANGAADYGYVRIGRDSVNFAPDARIRVRCSTETDGGAIYLKDVGISIRQ